MVSKLLLADTNLLTTPGIKPFIASRASVVSLSKKLYPYCSVQVGFRNRFKRYFKIKLKLNSI